MAGLLAGFLQEQARTPFVWGASDCALFLADWVRLATGIETADDLRGQYDGPRSAAEVSGGSLAFVVGRCAARAGLKNTEDAKPGDIAVLKQPRGEVCAIRTPTGWAMRDRRCIYVAPVADVPVLECWKVPQWLRSSQSS